MGDLFQLAYEHEEHCDQQASTLTKALQQCPKSGSERLGCKTVDGTAYLVTAADQNEKNGCQQTATFLAAMVKEITGPASPLAAALRCSVFKYIYVKTDKAAECKNVADALNDAFESFRDGSFAKCERTTATTSITSTATSTPTTSATSTRTTSRSTTETSTATSTPTATQTTTETSTHTTTATGTPTTTPTATHTTTPTTSLSTTGTTSQTTSQTTTATTSPGDSKFICKEKHGSLYVSVSSNDFCPRQARALNQALEPCGGGGAVAIECGLDNGDYLLSDKNCAKSVAVLNKAVGIFRGDENRKKTLVKNGTGSLLGTFAEEEAACITRCKNEAKCRASNSLPNKVCKLFAAGFEVAAHSDGTAWIKTASKKEELTCAFGHFADARGSLANCELYAESLNDMVDASTDGAAGCGATGQSRAEAPDEPDDATSVVAASGMAVAVLVLVLVLVGAVAWLRPRSQHDGSSQKDGSHGKPPAIYLNPVTAGAGDRDPYAEAGYGELEDPYNDDPHGQVDEATYGPTKPLPDHDYAVAIEITARHAAHNHDYAVADQDGAARGYDFGASSTDGNEYASVPDLAGGEDALYEQGTAPSEGSTTHTYMALDQNSLECANEQPTTGHDYRIQASCAPGKTTADYRLGVRRSTDQHRPLEQERATPAPAPNMCAEAETDVDGYLLVNNDDGDEGSMDEASDEQPVMFGVSAGLLYDTGEGCGDSTAPLGPHGARFDQSAALESLYANNRMQLNRSSSGQDPKHTLHSDSSGDTDEEDGGYLAVAVDDDTGTDTDDDGEEGTMHGSWPASEQSEAQSDFAALSDLLYSGLHPNAVGGDSMYDNGDAFGQAAHDSGTGCQDGTYAQSTRRGTHWEYNGDSEDVYAGTVHQAGKQTTKQETVCDKEVEWIVSDSLDLDLESVEQGRASPEPLYDNCHDEDALQPGQRQFEMAELPLQRRGPTQQSWRRMFQGQGIRGRTLSFDGTR